MWMPVRSSTLLQICPALSGTPKVCFIGTATGDDKSVIAGAYSALSERFRPSHLELFSMPNVDDVRGHLLNCALKVRLEANTAVS